MSKRFPVPSLLFQVANRLLLLSWESTPCSTETPYTSKELSTSFLSFLKQLKVGLPEGTLVSVAVGPLPFETPQIEVTSDETSSDDLEDISTQTDDVSTATDDEAATVTVTVTSTSTGDLRARAPATTSLVDTPLEEADLLDVSQNATEGSIVSTTFEGEYRNVSAFASVVDYISELTGECFYLFRSCLISNFVV